MSQYTDIDKAHEPKDIDLSLASRGVWLVKVPKYLSEQWKTCSSGTDVGKMVISKTKIPNKKPDIVFTSFDVSKSKTHTVPSPVVSIPSASNSGSKVLLAPAPVPRPIPAIASGTRNHKFIITGAGSQNLVVMSQMKTDAAAGKEPIEKVSIEGKVLQRAECHPIVDASYTQLKREQVKAQNTPVRKIQLLPGIVQSYKPVSNHASNLTDKKTKKMEVKKSRAEKEKVMDILFSAFEKHQFYNVKDLVGITQQPVPYLKEILREICNYNVTAPHKNMWELKPEFRHYKQHGDPS